MRPSFQASCRIVLSLVFLLWGGQAGAGEPAGAVSLLRDRLPCEQPDLMVIGVPHFANPGHDVVNVKVDDVLVPARQQQIAAVVEDLAKFGATKVAVEWPSNEQADLDARYDAYRAGRYRLGRNEVDQIGLRLARLLNLPRVHAVDWNEMPPGRIEDFDFEAYAKNVGGKMQARLDRILDPRPAQQRAQRMRQGSMREWLSAINAPEQLQQMNRNYFDYAMFGNAAESPGANWVANWYGRNLKIFANLVRLADGTQDRVLMVYGVGHAFLQREFAAQSGAFNVIDPELYLRDAGRVSRNARGACNAQGAPG